MARAQTTKNKGTAVHAVKNNNLGGWSAPEKKGERRMEAGEPGNDASYYVGQNQRNSPARPPPLSLMHSGAFTKVYVGWNGNSTGASQSLGPELTLRTK